MDLKLLFSCTNILSHLQAKLIWIFFFFAFACKIPLFPLHIWLPEAHVEAPTSGSILLASLLLKLGGYAILRFLLGLMPNLSFFFTPLVYTLCLLGLFFSSFIALRQIDLKRIIAYSSIAHMSYCTIGFFSCNVLGITAAIQFMLSHGIISAGLFVLIGFLYDRYGTRLILYYRGLGSVMPIFTFYFIIFIVSNSGFPLLANFVGELLIFIQLVGKDFFISCLINMSLYISGIYSI